MDLPLAEAVRPPVRGDRREFYSGHVVAHCAHDGGCGATAGGMELGPFDQFCDEGGRRKVESGENMMLCGGMASARNMGRMRVRGGEAPYAW